MEISMHEASLTQDTTQRDGIDFLLLFNKGREYNL